MFSHYTALCYNRPSQQHNLATSKHLHTTKNWRKCRETATVNIAYLIGAILILLVLAGFGSTLLLKRAIKQVVNSFREHDATGIRSAKTVAELELAPKSFFRRQMGLRDYKPHALQLLMSNDIIRATRDGKLYLSEDKLADSRFKQ